MMDLEIPSVFRPSEAPRSPVLQNWTKSLSLHDSLPKRKPNSGCLSSKFFCLNYYNVDNLSVMKGSHAISETYPDRADNGRSRSVARRIKVKEESPGPLSTETKLLGHCKPILALKSTLFHNQKCYLSFSLQSKW